MPRARSIKVAVVAAAMMTLAACGSVHAEELSGTLEPGPYPLAYKIFDTAAKTFISRSDLFDRLAATPHVLLGETHDNPHHHSVQADVLGQLAARDRKPVVVFEMISAKQADALEGILVYNRDIGAASPDALAIALQWDASGWPGFALYRPIFAAALGFKLTIAAGEPVPEDKASVLALTKAAPLSVEENTELIADLKTSHCGVMPDAVLPKVAVAQRKLDAKLALAMQAAAKTGGDGTVLIAGSGHARKDRGVPHLLRHLGAKHVSVLMIEVAEGQENPSDVIEPDTADYVWFTPPQKRDDPCIALRKKFGEADE